MASSLNKVFLLGNLTRDPDLRYLPNGSGVCEFGLAVNRRFVSNGKEIDETCFVDIVVWGKAAENCKQFLEKGSQALIEGRLQFDQWEDRNGGGKRSRLRVVADQVQFMSRRSDGGGNYGQGDGGYNAPPAGGNYGQPQGGNYGQQGGYGGGYAQNDGGAPQMPRVNNYQQRSAAPQMPRQVAPQAPGSMPRAPQQQMPPMPPEGAFNPDEGMEDDIPF
ncbi:single-stranded DNA-binding protein [Victivallis vadensis]|mgnify:FL=1|uniref:Single-stranded DNA-binding protein n=1 Tax=Victivallis vadensis TaxID=172901 RepID=A0A2U1B2A6_9BACT|nr:single-stranded DNA-binding protein [Victivallis vadensis]PVY42793.1 single-strand binding protein [Victivallis vadensis]